MFPRFGIHTYQAIVFNYFICVCCAWVALGDFPVSADIASEEWFPYAAALGALFIVGFNCTAYTIQQFGVTIGAVMQKMSIIMSVTWPIWFYDESASGFKLFGIFLAILAILFTNKPSEKALENLTHQPRWLLIFPALTLLISGIIEILLFEVEQINPENADLLFIATLFGMAGCLGALFLIGGWISGKMRWSFKNLLAGIALGVPNFFSIYYLLKILGIGWEGSVVFPVNNVSIIALSAVVAFFFFSEKLSRWNWWGVALAILAILCIAWS